MLIASTLLFTQLPSSSAFDRTGHAFASTDTVEYVISLETTFTTNLPATINETAVDEYRPLHVPAESWTVGRSFYWSPRVDDEGYHELTFLATQESDPIDTLVLVLDVQPQ